MGQRVLKDELLSLGVDMTKIDPKNKKDFEELVDNVKQTMIREFRAAYMLKENDSEIKSVTEVL